MDKRIVKTKKRLRKAFMELMSDSSFSQITVQNICSRANINRMTFYKHYADKYELLSDCFSEIEQEIRAELERNQSKFVSSPESFLHNLVESIVNECCKRKALIQKLTLQDNFYAMDITKGCIQKSIEKLIAFLGQNYSMPLPKEYLSVFLANGGCSIVYDWLTHQQDYPKEQFIDDLSKFFLEITKCCFRIQN